MPAKQTMLVWGPSGSGKSGLIATAARGFHQETGKKVRLVTAESAQSMSQLAGLVEEGIVEGWFLDSRQDVPFERIWQATLGHWPVDPLETFSPLIPAFSIQYLARCDKHQKTVWQSDKAPGVAEASKLICPDCKEPLMLRTNRIPNPKNGIDKVGMYLFEGLTEFSAMMMHDMEKRVARGESYMGSDVGLKFKDGDLEIAGNNQNHYMAAQSQIKHRVDESKHLLGIDYVIWSAVAADDRDPQNKRMGRCFGPKVAGQAATSDIPRWFGPTLGTIVVPGLEPEYRLYLSTFFQTWDSIDAKVPNICDNRIPTHQLKRQKGKVVNVLPKTNLEPVPDYLVVDPNDPVVLWKVLKMIEERQKGGFGGKTILAAK